MSTRQLTWRQYLWLLAARQMSWRQYSWRMAARHLTWRQYSSRMVARHLTWRLSSRNNHTKRGTPVELALGCSSSVRKVSNFYVQSKQEGNLMGFRSVWLHGKIDTETMIIGKTEFVKFSNIDIDLWNFVQTFIIGLLTWIWQLIYYLEICSFMNWWVKNCTFFSQIFQLYILFAHFLVPRPLSFACYSILCSILVILVVHLLLRVKNERSFGQKCNVGGVSQIGVRPTVEFGCDQPWNLGATSKS